MICTTICDDNLLDIQIIEKILKRLENKGYPLEISSFMNGKKLAEEVASGKRFDLIFLDMCMKPIDGIETAKLIRKYDKDVCIFITTSNMSYAIEGYSINAWRYFMKPLDEKLLIKEIKAFLDRKKAEIDEKYVFNTEKGIISLPIKDIYYFESFSHTIVVHTKTNDYNFIGKISDIEAQLCDKYFFRVHKSYLANLKQASKYYKGVLFFDDESKIYVSKHRAKDVRQHFLDCL